MNSFISRLNAIFAYTMSILAVLCFACFLSTAFDQHINDVNIKVGRILIRRAQDLVIPNEVNDLGYVAVNLDTELSSLFNWNVKQLFLFLTAEYKTQSNSVNQVVLWDKIVRRGENTRLNYANLNPKYYFFDDGNGLLGNQNVTLTLNWNVIPNVGRLNIASGRGSHRFSFPAEYLTRKS